MLSVALFFKDRRHERGVRRQRNENERGIEKARRGTKIKREIALMCL